MYNSESTSNTCQVSSLNQYTAPIQPAPALDFPRQAIVTCANRVFGDNGVNYFDGRRIRNGEVVTLTGRAGLTFYTFQIDGIEGYVSAKGVEVCEPEQVVDQDLASLVSEIFNIDTDPAYRFAVLALVETFHATPDLPTMLMAAAAYQATCEGVN